MKRGRVLTAIVVVGLTVAGVAAHQQPPPGQPAGRGGGGGGIPPAGTIQKIRDNLYRIPGAGPNTLVFVMQDGVALVDTKLANNGDAIMKQVRTVTDKPITFIINSHSHPDHNGSNDFFPPSVEVVTHENNRKRVAANPKTAAQRNMLADRTFTNTLRLGSGADRIDLYYFGPGHTDNDAFVVFPSVRTMFTGDQMAWDMAPLIDPPAGGSVIALPDSLEKAVKGMPNIDIVVEGHANVNTWAGFVEYTRFNRALLEAAKAGLGTRTPEEIVADLAKQFPKHTADQLIPGVEYGNTPRARAIINVNVAFQELKGEPVTTNFGPPRGGGAGGRGAVGRGAAPQPGAPAGPAPTQPPPGK